MNRQWGLLIAALGLGLGSAGCYQPVHALGGGATTEPTVTILLSDKASDAATGEAPASTGGVTVAGYGTFKGRVVLSGAAPVLPPLLAKGAPTKDAICAANTIPDESIVSENGGLGNVFVYLKKVPGGEVPPPPTDPIPIDQKGCHFLPHAAVCRVKQPLVFMNSDPVAHNTAFSPPGSNTFNQTIVANDTKGVPYVYSRPEAVPVRAKCDFHAWMGSYHLPLNHPWGVVTAPDGTFEITGVPGAPCEFVVWHEKAGYINRGLKVTIQPDQTVEQEITVDASKLAAK